MVDRSVGLRGDDAIQQRWRAACASDDAAGWTLAAETLLRAGQVERAAVAAERGLRRGAELGSDVLRAVTPSLSSLTPRLIEFSRRSPDDRPPFGLARGRRGLPPGLAWAQDGGVVFAPAALAESPFPQLGSVALTALDLEAGSQRLIATGLDAVHAVARHGPVAVVRSAGSYGFALLLFGAGDEPGLIAAVPASFPAIVTACVALADPPTALVADSSRARAFRFDERAGFSTVLDVPALAGRFGADGSLAVVAGGELRLHDPLASEPRVRVDLGPFSKHRRVYPVGRGALVADADLVLHGADGALLARSPVPAGLRPQDLVQLTPSPSGLLVAFVDRSPKGSQRDFGVVELETGQARRFTAPGRVMNMAWSPSGRRLAVSFEGADFQPVPQLLVLAPGEHVGPTPGDRSARADAPDELEQRS